MADTPLNATFFAFKKREPGGVLLRATIAYAIVIIALFAGFAALNWQAFVDYFNWAMSLAQYEQTMDPAANPFATLPPSVLSLIPMYLLFMLLSYLLLASYEAACLKWMIHGESGGFMGLTLGADTWRVYFTYWLWYLLLMAVYLLFVMLVLIMGVGAAFGAQAGGGDVNPAMFLALFGVIIALILVMIYFAVRFAPAAATSIARRRFAFFDAWKVTKGRFWSLLGSYLLLFLMYFVGIIVLSIGIGVLMSVSVVGYMQSAEPQSPEEVFSVLSSPSVWVPLAAVYAVMIAGAFVFYVALFGVNARAASLALEEGRIQAAQ